MGRAAASSRSRSLQYRRKGSSRRQSYSPERRPIATPTRGRSRSRSQEDRRSRAQLRPREEERSESRRRDESYDASCRYQHERRKPDLSKPPSRPGYDTDRRFKDLSDDPRYFQGAELGKAQKAALGATGLAGRNTASFDPKSTLVRPAMRVIYGNQGKRFEQSQTTHDDVVVVPSFLCAEEDLSVFDALVGDLRQFRSEGAACDPCDRKVVSRIVAKMCKYFSIDDSKYEVQVRWYHKANASSPREYASAGFSKMKGHNCTVNLALGATCEFAMKRGKTGETMYFPQMNGTLLLIGKAVTASWKGCGDGAVSTAPKGVHVSITVLGTSSIAVEDKVLADPKEAPAKTPCRDFKLGRCNYGDRCKFSHGEDEEEESSGSNSIVAWPTRPMMRVITVPTSERYNRTVSHDDVIVVPEFFCAEDDLDIYYKLIQEMRESQAEGTRKAEWISWHEGAHLLSQNPTGSKTYQKVLDKMCEYFNVAEGNRGTRFNWYRDGSDWKPFHHDSAAFNADRAKNQNCTVLILTSMNMVRLVRKGCEAFRFHGHFHDFSLVGYILRLT
eukprot:TRINITY_DN10223_c0_g1_i1.p1 TRINITY_DN10223_c0_g1~~TRINITY_DN10223_c0_g1_i1.p1  ORF type:complete len:558 (+),score=72.38 TRINITY_DN10223_c0_g1_i1:63-1736(+)